jgi:hypothetical protein
MLWPPGEATPPSRRTETSASRTTHPKVLNLFSRFFSLLGQRSISIENPYLWCTKRDVVEIIRKQKCEGMIGDTVSPGTARCNN